MNAARSARVDLSDDRGFVAGAEALLFGAVLFVVGVLVMANGWAVLDARFAAASAARAATRAAIATPVGEDPHEHAQAAADLALEAHAPRSWSSSLIAEREPRQRRCQEVRYRVVIDVPLIALDGWRSDMAVSVAASSIQVVDPYRSGLPAGRECPW